MKNYKPTLKNAGTKPYVSNCIKNINPENSSNYNTGAAWQGNNEIESGTNGCCESVNKKPNSFIKEYKKSHK